MTPLLEEPGYALVGGGLLVVVMVVFWIYSGMKGFMYATLGCLALTIGLVMLEQAVVTKYESVEDSLRTMATDIEKNDVELLYPHISTTTEQGQALRTQIERDMRYYSIDHVEIDDNLKVELFPNMSPPRALCSFTVFVRGSIRHSGDRPPGAVPATCEVTLYQESERWRVAEYRYEVGLRGRNASIGRKKGRFMRHGQ